MQKVFFYILDTEKITCTIYISCFVHTHHGSSSASVKIDSDKATIGHPASSQIPVGKVKIKISIFSLMVPAFCLVVGCWFGNPRHPDLRTWVEGVSSADLLHEVKHAEAHTLAKGLLDLVFTKHKHARNTIPSLSGKTLEFFRPTASI